MTPLGTSDASGRSSGASDDRDVIASAIATSETAAIVRRIRESSATWSSSVLAMGRRVTVFLRDDDRGLRTMSPSHRPTVAEATSRSRTLDVALAVAHVADRAISGSRTESVLRWMERVARQSFIYRWFTDEPEPDVIVLDLRETYAFGPVIGAIEGLRSPWRRSSVRELLGRTRDPLAKRPLGVVGAILVVIASTTMIMGFLRADLDWPRFGLAALVGLVGLRWLGSSVTWTELRSSRAITWLARVLEPPGDD